MKSYNRYDTNVCMQIVNRSNNIFELVTVGSVSNRLEMHGKENLGSETDGDEHRNLRLKGGQMFSI